jgi:hypothetical protein
MARYAALLPKDTVGMPSWHTVGIAADIEQQSPFAYRASVLIARGNLRRMSVEFVSGLLAIIDRGISLMKHRQARNQAIVKEVIDPMFQDLEKVQQNYSVMFQKLISRITADTSEESVRSAARAFSQERMEYFATRQKLTWLIGSYSSAFSKDPLIDTFLQAVWHFTHMAGGTSSASLAVERFLADILEDDTFVPDPDMLSPRFPKSASYYLTPEMIKSTVMMIKEVQNATNFWWTETVQAYGAVKSSYSIPR